MNSKGRRFRILRLPPNLSSCTRPVLKPQRLHRRFIHAYPLPVTTPPRALSEPVLNGLQDLVLYKHVLIVHALLGKNHVLDFRRFEVLVRPRFSVRTLIGT